MGMFVAGIVLRNGEMVCAPEYTDAHEDLIDVAGLQDDGRGNFVRVELLPPDDYSKIGNLDAWTFKVDQPDTPNWFDRDKPMTYMRERVRQMFVDNDRLILIGGCWILLSGAKVAMVRSARIPYMCGDAQIRQVKGDSRINKMGEDTKITNAVEDNSRIGRMEGRAWVNKLVDDAQVGWLTEDAVVADHYDYSRIIEDTRNKT